MPTEFLNALTDDQFALLGCLLALAVTGTMMSLSYYVGKRVHGEAFQQRGDRTHVVPLSVGEPGDKEADGAPQDEKPRRTAA